MTARTDQGVNVLVEGCPVQFPFTPYPQQEEFMRCVIQALNMRHDAVLESPTGTGKTLSLLCASLAWLNLRKQAMVASFQDAAAIAGGQQVVSSGVSGAGQKIFYCSRTHSQLAQVVKELNTTMYRGVRCAILGGRDQLCTNDRVLKQKDNAGKTAMCRALRKKHQCHLFNAWDKAPIDKLDNIYYDGKIPDIEDLNRIARKNGHCAFYRSRQMADSADIVMLPYNYLLDPNMRRLHKIDLKGSIIIFDEAHNIENICEESASCILTSTELGLAIKELQDSLQKQRDADESIRDAFDNTTAGFGAVEMETKVQETLDMSKGLQLLERLLNLEPLIEKYFEKGKEMKDNYGNPIKPDGRVLDGCAMVEMLSEAQLGKEAIAVMEMDKVFSAASALLSEQSGIERNPGRHLEKIGSFIHTVISSGLVANASGTESGLDYKLWINVEKREPESKKPIEYSLSFWCFDASVTLRALRKQAVHSIIVTSGTLSPIEAFTSRMGLNVGSVYTGDHAAKSSQVQAFIVEEAESITEKDRMISLDGSYRNRAKLDYVNAVGRVVAKCAEIVPQGMLVFFASFMMMDQMMKTWKSWTVMDRISQFKAIAVEPKDKVAMKEQQILFDQHSRTPRGAVLFAVLRGKLSEGINFSDHHARAVVVIGIPYPPAFDTKIILKKDILDEKRALFARKKKEGKVIEGEEAPIDSQLWYSTEAMRAVNQALGRVLRHRNDFGIVVLADKRYRHTKRTFFPSWLRPSIEVPASYAEFARKGVEFFKAHGLVRTKRIADSGDDTSTVDPATKQSKRKLNIQISDENVGVDMFASAPKVCEEAEPAAKKSDSGSVLSCLTSASTSTSTSVVPPRRRALANHFAKPRPESVATTVSTDSIAAQAPQPSAVARKKIVIRRPAAIVEKSERTEQIVNTNSSKMTPVTVTATSGIASGITATKPSASTSTSSAETRPPTDEQRKQKKKEYIVTMKALGVNIEIMTAAKAFLDGGSVEEFYNKAAAILLPNNRQALIDTAMFIRKEEQKNYWMQRVNMI